MLKAVTLREIEQIFAVTDALGLSREQLVIPLAPGRPGHVRRLPTGKIEIVVDAAVPFEAWLRELPARLREVTGP